MYPPEVVNRIETLRQFSRIRKLTLEEQMESIQLIRQERVSASYASAGAKVKKAAAVKTDGADVLAGLFAQVAAKQGNST